MSNEIKDLERKRDRLDDQLYGIEYEKDGLLEPVARIKKGLRGISKTFVSIEEDCSD